MESRRPGHVHLPCGRVGWLDQTVCPMAPVTRRATGRARDREAAAARYA